MRMTPPMIGPIGPYCRFSCFSVFSPFSFVSDFSCFSCFSYLTLGGGEGVGAGSATCTGGGEGFRFVPQFAQKFIASETLTPHFGQFGMSFHLFMLVFLFVGESI